MDRRTVWAILLMMVIAIAPAILIKRPPRPVPGAADSTARGPAPAPAPAPARPAPATGTPAPDSLRAARDSGTPAAAPAAARGDTVRVSSPLYTYGVSTVGGRLVEARLLRYRSIAPGDSGVAEILPPDSRLLGLTLVIGRDTIRPGRLGVLGLDHSARRHRSRRRSG